MLIFLHGTDTFRAKEKLDELKKKFLEKNGGKEYLISSIGEDSFNLAEFRNKVLSAGFFAEKKLIILDFRLQILDFQKEILEVIKRIPDETVLIVRDKSESEKLLKSDLGKYLLKQKFVFEFNPLSGNALVSWVRERAKNYGSEIDNEAIAEICDILGSDLWKIDLELSKLCAYASSLCHPALACPEKSEGRSGNAGSLDPRLRGDDSGKNGDDSGVNGSGTKKNPSVTKKIVSEMLAREAEENIFKFIDALATKNKRLALITLEEEFRAGAADLQILGAVARQIRILLQIKAGTGLKPVPTKDMLAKQLGIHPYVAQKSLQQVKNFQLNELKNIYRRLLEIDISIKTGGASPRAMFGRMIAKI